jgi:hypothetical protein
VSGSRCYYMPMYANKHLSREMLRNRAMLRAVDILRDADEFLADDKSEQWAFLAALEAYGAASRRNPTLALDWLVDAEAHHADAREARLRPAAERGQPFIDGPKQPRRHRMTSIIDRALIAVGLKAKTEEVFNWMRENDSHGAIDETDLGHKDGPRVYWVGRKNPSTVKSIYNRISERRKILKDKIPVFD